MVQQGGHGVEPAHSHQVEHRVEVGGQGPEAERAGGNELAHRRRIDGQDLPDHRHRVVRGGHGQLVHEVDGDVHAGVGITV